MYEASHILEMFEARMRELGITQAELGQKAFGKADNTAIQSLKKGSIPAIDRVAAMARALNLELYLGPPRKGDPVTHVELDGTDYARVPLHDAYLSAGPGALNGDATIIDQLAFRSAWLERAGVNSDQARVARVRGDSMAPGISDGDLVLIDTAKSLRDVPKRANKDRRPLPVFAFLQDGEARVKRLERPADRALVLLSDNPTFPPEVIDPGSGNFILLGQVVWSGYVWR